MKVRPAVGKISEIAWRFANACGVVSRLQSCLTPGAPKPAAEKEKKKEVKATAKATTKAEVKKPETTESRKKALKMLDEEINKKIGFAEPEAAPLKEDDGDEFQIEFTNDENL